MHAQATPEGQALPTPGAYGPQAASTRKRLQLADGRTVFAQRLRQRPAQPIILTVENRKGRVQGPPAVLTSAEAIELAGVLVEAAL